MVLDFQGVFGCMESATILSGRQDGLQVFLLDVLFDVEVVTAIVAEIDR